MIFLEQIVKAKETTIIDVRTPMEFEEDHISGAINIPLDELPYKMDEIRKIQQPLLLYCRSGGRSSMAASIMKQHGIAEVYNGGGINDIKYLLKK